MFKLQLKNKPSSAIWLVGNTTVGKHPDCTLVINDPNLADVHLELLVKDEDITVRDRSNGLPLLVNQQIYSPSKKLKHQDCIKLNKHELEIIDPKNIFAESPEALDLALSTPSLLLTSERKSQNHWRLVAAADWLEGAEFVIDEPMLLGRDSKCDITIAGTHLSRKHAKITPLPSGLVIEDLDSSNGTFVNGSRIDKKTLNDGDEIKFDTVAFYVAAPVKANIDKTLMRPSNDINSELKGHDLSALRNEGKDPLTISAAERQWKTKPTSLGNRAPEDEITADIKSLSSWFYYLAAGVCAIITFVLISLAFIN